MRSGRLLLVVMVWLAGASVGSMVGPTFAAFSATTRNTGNSFSGAPDWAAPSVPASVIRKGSGGVAGYIKQGGAYRVFALVTDLGNPPSGVQTVTANVSNITGGQTTVAMSAGEWTIGGVTYNYRSAEVTAGAVLTEGSKSYSITARDVIANQRTVGGFSVAVDNVVPAGYDIRTQNGGGTVGRAEEGDKVVFEYTEQIEPVSVLSGWSGPATNVVVKVLNSGSNDKVQVWDSSNTVQLPLGTVDLNGNYVTSDSIFGDSGTASTMVQAGGLVTVTLGTHTSGTVRTAAEISLLWWPSSVVTDLAGNNCSAVSVQQLGPPGPAF